MALHIIDTIKPISDYPVAEAPDIDVNGERLDKVLKQVKEDIQSAGTNFTTDNTLTLKDGVLKVNTANDAEADNTLPITSAAVHVVVGNIDALLDLI